MHSTAGSAQAGTHEGEQRDGNTEEETKKVNEVTGSPLVTNISLLNLRDSRKVGTREHLFKKGDALIQVLLSRVSKVSV